MGKYEKNKPNRDLLPHPSRRPSNNTFDNTLYRT